MLAITAVVAIVFSVGMIVGQHLLFEDSLPPVVSTADAQGSSDTAGHDAPTVDETAELNLFSFYDVLTAANLDAGADGPRPVGGEAFASPRPTDPASASSDSERNASEPAFGIDDDRQPNTDDGSIPARYTLQIASHPTMEQARTEMDHLRAMDLDPHVVAADVPEQGKYYRVRVGKFQNEDQARAFQARIEAEHSLRTIITPL